MTEFSIEVPPEKAGGVYADFVSLWHSDDVFTLDFAAVTSPPQAVVDPMTQEQSVQVAAQVVSRVRIPPGQVFEIMKALEQHLTEWERSTGRSASGG